MAGIIDDRPGHAAIPSTASPTVPSSATVTCAGTSPRCSTRSSTACGRSPRSIPTVESIGIDTWAVDYGLLDGDGAPARRPDRLPRHAHRRRRSARVHELVAARTSCSRSTGCSSCRSTRSTNSTPRTRGPALERARHTSCCCPTCSPTGSPARLRTEYTNAIDHRARRRGHRAWSTDAARPPRHPRRRCSRRSSSRARSEDGCCPTSPSGSALAPSTVVTTVGSHDTASAVVGVPGDAAPNFAYVASGTWSLVGVELDEPVVTPAQRSPRTSPTRAASTVAPGSCATSAGCGCSRSRCAPGPTRASSTTCSASSPTPPRSPTVARRIDVDDPAFIPPGDMPARIRAAARRRRPSAPARGARRRSPAASRLARRGLRPHRSPGGRHSAAGRVDVIHIVGGGSQNELLCRLHRRRRPACRSIAGPVEATALGNVLVQARAIGAADGTHRGAARDRRRFHRTRRGTNHGEPDHDTEPHP